MVKSLKESKLDDLNRENLLKGLDSEGQDMPFYNPESEYGEEKFRRNPKNMGKWDLKNTGQYHKGIKVTITKDFVSFRQIYNNSKVRWLDERLDKANRNPLGITKEQLYEIQMKNKPELFKKLDNIISNGM